MQAVVLIAQAILVLLPMVTTGAEHLWAFVNATRAAAQQAGEWPPELEVGYQMALLKKADSAAAQPDPVKPVIGTTVVTTVETKKTP